MSITTITLDTDLKKKLDKLKVHPRESYNGVLFRLLSNLGSKGKVMERDNLIESIEILSSPDVMKSLAKSLEDLRRGRTYSIEEV